MTATILRPNVATILRKGEGTGVSMSGDRVPAIPTVIGYELPALIDAIAKGMIQSELAGPMATSISHLLFLDPLPLSQIPSGTTPGAFFTLNGVVYRLSGNGRSAMPDLRVGDKIVDEDFVEYLVMAVSEYTIVQPSLQAELAVGKAWTGLPSLLAPPSNSTPTSGSGSYTGAGEGEGEILTTANLAVASGSAPTAIVTPSQVPGATSTAAHLYSITVIPTPACQASITFSDGENGPILAIVPANFPGGDVHIATPKFFGTNVFAKPNGLAPAYSIGVGP